MKPVRLLLVTLVLAFATAALAKVHVDFDEKADFSNYKTYAWRKGTPAHDPFMQQHIERAVDDQLQAKGLTKAAGTPDLYVVTHAATKEKKYTSYVNLGYSNPLDEVEMTQVIDIGTLRVELVDAKSKRVVWRAVATKSLSQKPEKNKKLIDKYTKKMFKHFPPRR